eukprot:356876-Amphidinium_carterae.1
MRRLAMRITPISYCARLDSSLAREAKDAARDSGALKLRSVLCDCEDTDDAAAQANDRVPESGVEQPADAAAEGHELKSEERCSKITTSECVEAAMIGTTSIDSKKEQQKRDKLRTT